MMKTLRWFGFALSAAAVAIVVTGVVARFHDGPLGPFPGGPLQGTPILGPVADWSFAADLSTITIQTFEPPRSRTVWLVVHEENLYVPSGLVAAKDWPHQLEDDPRLLLRVDGKLYLRQASRITDPALLEPVWTKVAAKYGPSVEGDYERNWLFRMDPVDGDG